MARSTKLILLIGALFALFLSIPLFAHLENRPSPAVSLLTESEYRVILDTQHEVADSAVRGKLLISGEPAPYDAGMNRFFVPESMESSDWSNAVSWSDPSYTARVVPDPLYGDKAEAIRSGHVFTLLISNGRNYHLEHFVCTGLPAITLETESEKCYLFENGVPTGTLHAFYPTVGSYEVKTSLATFRQRGNTTARFDKTPLRICLYFPNGEKNHTSLIGMREDDDWILNSLYTDSSKIRDKLSIDLWNSIAATNSAHDLPGTRMEYVEIFIDGSYEGLFGLLEPIGRKSTELNQKTDILYQGKSFLLRQEDFKAAKGSLASLAIEIKYPKKWTGDEVWDPIVSFVDCFYWNPDQHTTEEMLFWLDLGNAIDHALFLQASTATDNFFHNTFYLARPRADGSKYLTKIPWDLNYSFGDRWDDYLENLYTCFDMELVSSDQTTKDMQRLLERKPQELGKMLADRWAELRRDVLSDERMTAAVENAVIAVQDSGAFARDSARWPGETNDETEYRMILSFIRERLAYLDGYYDRLSGGGDAS